MELPGFDRNINDGLDRAFKTKEKGKGKGTGKKRSKAKQREEN